MLKKQTPYFVGGPGEVYYEVTLGYGTYPKADFGICQGLLHKNFKFFFYECQRLVLGLRPEKSSEFAQ